MPCCVADEYGGWCHEAPTKVVDVDGEEREYCIFHAPRSHKWMPPEAFNELVLQQLEAAREAGRECNLAGCVFPGAVAFKWFNTEAPMPPTDFSWCRFHGEADFFGASMDGPTSFAHATFESVADFSQSGFGGDVNFRAVRFNGPVEFQAAQFAARAFFIKTRFTAGADFWRCRFLGVTHFGEAVFEDVTFFGDTHFDQECSFQLAVFHDLAYFGLTAFAASADFTQCSALKDMRFEAVALNTVSLLDMDLRRVQFINCRWPKVGARHAVYDEVAAKDPARVEAVYVRLKHIARAEQNDALFSDWHFGQMEMRRKAHPARRHNPVSLTNLYRLLSGYGERPARAGLALVCLLAALFASVWLACSAPDGGGLSFAQALDATLRLPLFADGPYAAAPLAHAWLLALGRIAVPVQVLLLAFALRNAFRR